MHIDFILIVCCEWIAFLSWLFIFKKIKEPRYKLFTIYLGIIAVVELLNLIFNKSDNSWSNFLVMQINVPLQFLFLINFLLYYPNSKTKYLSIFLSLLFILVFILEKTKVFYPPIYFNSVAYGVGTLLLIVALIVSLIQIFKAKNIIQYNQNTLFWIVMGLLLFYVGSFPYQTFRNYLWNTTKYNNIAYGLHYLSQSFNCIMYLLFAYAIKWKIK